MQGKRMHGDRGRYLVNMGEKCNLMIPWTKVQNFHCSYGSNHTIVLHWPQAIVSQLFHQFEKLETSSVQGTRIEETVKKSKSKRSRRRQFAITG